MRQYQIRLVAMNTAKCPKCDQSISNVHYEAHGPDPSSGFRGSRSFTAVARPCGHAIGAVPITWEMRLEEIDKLIRGIDRKVDYIHGEISQLFRLMEKNKK